MSEVNVTPWPETSEPEEATLRMLLEKENLNSSLWSRESGDRFPVQRYNIARVIYCIEGGIWFTLTDEGDRTIELEPGDRIDILAGIRHGAIVGMDGVTCLEGTPRVIPAT